MQKYFSSKNFFCIEHQQNTCKIWESGLLVWVMGVFLHHQRSESRSMYSLHGHTFIPEPYESQSSFKCHFKKPQFSKLGSKSFIREEEKAAILAISSSKILRRAYNHIHKEVAVLVPECTSFTTQDSWAPHARRGTECPEKHESQRILPLKALLRIPADRSLNNTYQALLGQAPLLARTMPM